MNTQFIGQPGSKQRVGDLLMELLQGKWGPFSRFEAAVAFAKRSGVRHLGDELEAFIKAGGYARVVVGVDHGVTSMEGLQLLLDFIGRGGEVWVFHNANPASTFHPKLYILEGTQRATVIVGSSNLTEGGLFTNCECAIFCELDLSQSADKEFLASAKKFVDSLCDPKAGIALRLDDAAIKRLLEVGLIIREGSADERREERRIAPQGQAAGAVGTLFRAAPVPPAPAVHAPAKGVAVAATAPKAAELRRGSILWRKKLAATDAQRQPGHATGGMRLTQAKWKVGGGKIDQTEYFRYIVFGNLPWTLKKQRPVVEAASASFEITVLGESLGTHRLEVSHKPSGEAGQGNYTSLLHWKALSKKIRSANLVGKTFSLYAPAKGTAEPYFIDIS